SEFRRLFGGLELRDRGLVAAAVLRPPMFSGGGFRLSFLARTLPAHLALLGASFGAFSVLALSGAIWAVRRRPLVAAVLLPYPLVALIFYSFWGHADPRYLAGFSLCVIPLVAIGAVLVCATLADARVALRRRAIVIGLVWACAWLVPRVSPAGERSPAGSLELAMTGAVTGCALLALVPGGGTPIAVGLAKLAPALALALAGIGRVATAAGERETFQQPQVE